jgi:hypothetical protein
MLTLLQDTDREEAVVWVNSSKRIRLHRWGGWESFSYIRCIRLQRLYYIRSRTEALYYTLYYTLYHTLR